MSNLVKSTAIETFCWEKKIEGKYQQVIYLAELFIHPDKEFPNTKTMFYYRMIIDNNSIYQKSFYVENEKIQDNIEDIKKSFMQDFKKYLDKAYSKANTPEIVLHIHDEIILMKISDERTQNIRFFKNTNHV